MHFSYFGLLSQLFHDGYQAIAINLMNEVTPSVSCGPSARLLKLVKLGLSIADGIISFTSHIRS